MTTLEQVRFRLERLRSWADSNSLKNISNELSDCIEDASYIINKDDLSVPCDGPCLDCKRNDVTFQVSTWLWNEVTGLSPDAGVLCVRCFERRAVERGIHLRNWTVELCGGKEHERADDYLE